VSTPVLVPCARGDAGPGPIEGPAAFAQFLEQFAGGYRAVEHRFFAQPRVLDVLADPERVELDVLEVVDEAARAGVAPIFFGGDHTITYPLLAAARERVADIALLVFDAHSDMQGSERELRNWNVMRRIAEDFGDVVLVHVGFRDIDVSSFRAATDCHVTAIDLVNDEGAFARALEALSGRSVYLSIDLDVLDPVFCRAVAAPISGGLSSLQLFAMLDALDGQAIVAADIVEYDHRRRAGGEMVLLADLFHRVGCLCVGGDRVSGQ
jgi:agmatinase